jgi:hypothetical protein
MRMFKVGDCVRNLVYTEQEGMIIEIFGNFWRLPEVDESVLTKEEWLLIQDTRFSYEEINLEYWYIVQLYSGEFMWSCHTRLEYVGEVDTKTLFL